MSVPPALYLPFILWPHIPTPSLRWSFHVCTPTPPNYIIDNLVHHDVQMFAPISPNINWNNLSNWTKTKTIFRQWSSQIHLSTTSNVIGRDPEFFSKNQIGGAAIITSGLWASKVIEFFQDESGFMGFKSNWIFSRWEWNGILYSNYNSRRQ